MEQEQISQQVPGSLWEALGNKKKDDGAAKEGKKDGGEDGEKGVKIGVKDDVRPS